MAVLVLDDFNRADNADLGASWTAITGEGVFEIVSNAIAPTSLSSDSGEKITAGLRWPDDQYAQAVCVFCRGRCGCGVLA